MHPETPSDDFPGLHDYNLADSYVLGIHLTGAELSFDLEVVIRPSHPDYVPPTPSEEYCYRRGRLSFARPSAVQFDGSVALRPTVDPDGSIDLGNVDSLSVGEDGRFSVVGDWGAILLRSEAPVMVLAPSDNAGH